MNENLISPFTIDVPQIVLHDLQQRLRGARFPKPLPDDGWDTGVPVDYLKDLAGHWEKNYDWRAQEKMLNSYAQFTTEIDGQVIHFLHIRSSVDGALPLLLTHGWPGSFVEFLDIIGPLIDPGTHGRDTRDAFHVVIPTLPGFGFSSPVASSGWDAPRIGRAWAELMKRLGYEKYGVQGGDIGAAVSPEVARAACDRVVGVHVNGSIGMPMHTPDKAELASLTELERDRFQRVQTFMQQEYGYIAIQSTRPQTLAAALVDSPIGQLAWIVDKFREWTVPRDTAPEEIVGYDRLLTNIMLYWVTGTAGSAAYIGYAQHSAWGTSKTISGVPTAALMFAHDVGIRRYAEVENNITRWTDIEDRGGHFAALEEPTILIEDLSEFFRPLR